SGDVSAYDIDARDLAMLDLGDASLGYAEQLSQLSLGKPGRGAHLGELMPAHVCFPALAGCGLAGGLPVGAPRVRGAALGRDITPSGVIAAHCCFSTSRTSSSMRCRVNRSSASGMAFRDQTSQLLALSLATKKIASRRGSNANSILISVA